MSKKVPHAQEVNVLNIEELMVELLTIKYATSKQGRRWLETSVRRDLTDPESWERTLRMLHMTSTPVVTPRENRIMQISNSHKNVVPPNVVIIDLDDPRYPWLARALERGDNVVFFGTSATTHNKIEHLLEVLNIRFRQDLDPAKLSVERLIQESDAWQKELEREVSMREGEVRSLGMVDDQHEAVLLLDKQAYRREGTLMHHCVGNYDPQVGKAIVSIRKEGESVATLELNVSKEVRQLGSPLTVAAGDRVSIVQIRGPRNVSVPPLLSISIDGWLRRTFRLREVTEVSPYGDSATFGNSREEDLCIRFCRCLVRSFRWAHDRGEIKEQLLKLMYGQDLTFVPHPSFSELLPDITSEFKFRAGSYTFSYRHQSLTVKRDEAEGPPLQRRMEDEVVANLILTHGFAEQHHRDMGPEIERRIRIHTAFDPNRRVGF